MDELEQKRQEARAAGYTDAEIDEFLGVQANPALAQSVPGSAAPGMDRQEERQGMAEGIAIKGAGAAAGLGGAYYGAKKLLEAGGNAFRGGATPPAMTPPAMTPMAPVTPPAMAPGPVSAAPAAGFNMAQAEAVNQRIGAQGLADLMKTGQMPAATPAAPAAPAQTVQQMALNKLKGLATQYGPAAARIGGGAAMAAYPGALNTGEDKELALQRQISDQMKQMPKELQDKYYASSTGAKANVMSAIRSGVPVLQALKQLR